MEGLGNRLMTYPKMIYALMLFHAGVIFAQQGSVDVTAAPFGAKCDGIRNDAAAIQSAINYVLSAGGGVVQIPAGRVCVLGSMSLNIPQGESPITIESISRGALRKSALYYSGTDAAIHVGNPNPTADVQWVTLRNFQISIRWEAGDNAVGIYWHRPMHWRMEQVYVTTEKVATTGNLTAVRFDGHSAWGGHGLWLNSDIGGGFRYGIDIVGTGAPIYSCFNHNSFIAGTVSSWQGANWGTGAGIRVTCGDANVFENMDIEGFDVAYLFEGVSDNILPMFNTLLAPRSEANNTSVQFGAQSAYNGVFGGVSVNPIIDQGLGNQVFGYFGAPYVTNRLRQTQVEPQTRDPGCASAQDIGKLWFDNTTGTTVEKHCVSASNQVVWKTVTYK